MNRRLFRGIILMFILALALTIAAKLAHAESSVGASQASASINIRITVLPTMRIVEQKNTPEGLQLTLWTNMRSIDFDGRTIRMERVGLNTITLPSLTTQSTAVVEVNEFGGYTIVSP